MTTATYFPAAPFHGVTTFDAPEISLAAVRQTNFPLAEMPRLMDGLFPEIFTMLTEFGAVVSGPPLSLHSRIPTDTADLAVGVPLTAPLSVAFELSSGFRVEPTLCPGGAVAATSYLGGYEGLGEAWGRFMEAVVGAGHNPSHEFFEAYVSNPAEITDLATLRTDLVVFLT